MNVEIIAIGREILDGRVIDTNSSQIADLLKPLGLVPRYGQRVDDDIERITEAFAIAAKRSRIVLVSGGLGPTSDDLTAEAAAKFLGESRMHHPEALAQIEEFFKRVQRPMTQVQRKQAYLPASCTILPNPIGTAPGFCVNRNGVSWFFMPGVPHEMKNLMVNQVIPRLPRKPAYRTMVWATHFTSEGLLQERLKPVSDKLNASIELSFRTRFPENHISLYGDCSDAASKALYDQSCGEITRILGLDVYASAAGTEASSLERVVVERARGAKAWISVAESCTGGLIAERLTRVPGASENFWGGSLCYDNSAKTRLGVPAAVIDGKGAVSREVAIAMAEASLKEMRGALDAAHSKGRRFFALSCTGIAGPDNLSDKPIGLAYIALARSDKETLVEEVHGRAGLDRLAYRRLFAQKALDLLRISLP